MLASSSAEADRVDSDSAAAESFSETSLFSCFFLGIVHSRYGSRVGKGGSSKMKVIIATPCSGRARLSLRYKPGRLTVIGIPGGKPDISKTAIPFCVLWVN